MCFSTLIESKNKALLSFFKSLFRLFFSVFFFSHLGLGLESDSLRLESFGKGASKRLKSLIFDCSRPDHVKVP
jgi:hypothetical protein